MNWLVKNKTDNQQVVPVNEQTTHPSNLVALAVQQGAELEKIEKLMALQERWEANEARKAYVTAMNAFKENPPKLFKDRHVSYDTAKGKTEYDHASLGNVAATISAAMAEHGLCHQWKTEQLDGGLIRVTCIITHAMGHSESNFLQASADQSGGKNNIQAVGSTVSYLQRYTLLSAVGLATQDMDDDGRGAGAPQGDPRPAAEPVLLPAYPDQLFQANYPTWIELINRGKQHDSIINKIESAYTLSDEQKTKIKSIK